MIKRTAILLALFLVALGMPIDIEAQVAGTISGYVRDESGAVIPGADVKATMIGQQLTRSAVTDETGFFNLLAMPRGNYEITAQLTGFRDAADEGRADVRREPARRLQDEPGAALGNRRRLRHRGAHRNPERDDVGSG